jgi:signal-transduction protein with cAMP-binding, CBS, and nucleotidyltransferase domain
METFINYIKQYIELTSEVEEVICSLVKIERVEKGHQIVKVGKVCNRMYFISKGTARTFFYQKGKDITHWIYPDNSMITSWHSYYLRKPSVEYVELTEASTLISLHYDEWQDLFEKYPELNKFGRLIVEQELSSIDDFYKGYYFLSAKEKYDLLISVFPTITQIANLGHIASMLGISQETLSRIRGK